MSSRRRDQSGSHTATPVQPEDQAADPYAEAVLEARLGRAPRDVLEATVVLEAWTGRPAGRAMTSARRFLRPEMEPISSLSRVDPFQDSERTSVVAEGVTLVLLIVSIAAWASPIRLELGPRVLSDAIRVALPIAVALQWGLRSRYLGRPHGLACLARDGLWPWILLLIIIDTPLVLLGTWGRVAALLVPIWVGGAILTRRGWGLSYAGVLLAATIAIVEGLFAFPVLIALTVVTLLMCVGAVFTRRQRTDARAGSPRRALMATAIGAVVGTLLVADPTLGWGVHGAHPAVALVPSVIGSYWGGYYLWNFYDAVPRGLQGVSLGRADGVALTDPAMSIFVGAIARLIIATTALSLLVVALGGPLQGVDSWSVFVAFGCVGTMSMLVGILEAFSLQRSALVAAGAALAVELLWRFEAPVHAPGLALAAGATAGVLVTLPPLVVRLAQSGRTLATTLWIQ
jgi:hypothetical protein